MSSAQEFPVRLVRTSPPSAEPGEALEALALLAEIETSVGRLHATGERSVIDILRVPLSARARSLLRETLGEGEVSAALDVCGRSTVVETAVPCVWWVCHRDARDEVQAESIEITPLPPLLRADIDAIPAGLAELRSRVALLRGGGPGATQESVCHP